MISCCVVGLGYIGLPTAAVLAKAGHRVIGVDVNAQVVATVNEGLIHIVEPDLDLAVAESVASGSYWLKSHQPRLMCYHRCAHTIPQRGQRHPSTQYRLCARRRSCHSAGPAPWQSRAAGIHPPVGTTEKVAQVITEASGLSIDQQIHRLLPGAGAPRPHSQGADQQRSSDRWPHPAAAAAGQAFYASFCQGELLATTARTVELVKLTENSFRDVNIAFANELSLVCDHLAINVRELIRLANHHPA